MFLAPRPVWSLALLGLAGFPAAAITYAFGPSDLRFTSIHVLLTWSAVVLGFLGGIRWSQETGREQPHFIRLAGAMLPPLGTPDPVPLSGPDDPLDLLGLRVPGPGPGEGPAPLT